MKVLRAAQMREVDRRTIEELGVPVVALMENAGRAVAEALADAVPDLAERSLVIVCGRGNNGGDGLVAARHLRSRGLSPQVVLLGRIAELKSPVVRGHAEAVRRMGIPIIEASGPSALEGEPGFALSDFEVIVDAVFGTGFVPPAKGLEARAIEAMVTAGEGGSFVLAVDLPSGLDADSGRIVGPAVAADLTVTFAAPKLAHFLAPAELLCGHLAVADITIPAELIEAPGHDIDLVDHDIASALMVPRRAEAHKGSFGHLLVVAGSRGKTGAAILTARAALRTGVGLVTVAVPESCLAIVAAGAPELMTEPLPEAKDGTLAVSALGRLRELVAARDALAIGPGLGTSPGAERVARALALEAAVPAVLDADALNAHMGRLAALGRAAAPRVLTPHPGEAARLLGRSAVEVNDDRLAAAAQLARKTRATVLLKGHRSVTAGPGGALWLNSTGNPGLATAGTGDALTGIVGALLAQGLGADLAAALGAFLHGLAGDLAAEAKSEPGLVASDLIEALPRAWLALRDSSRDEDDPEQP